MNNLRYGPNVHYYDTEGGTVHEFWKEGSNPKLAAIGARNRLPCGGHWIIGAGREEFAFCIEYAADSYDRMARVIECRPDNLQKWHELEVHLATMQVPLPWHTLKSRNEVAEMLGLEAA